MLRAVDKSQLLRNLRVWMGAESGSQRILDAMTKGTRVEQVHEARENLRRHGVRACFFLQFGYPGEGWKELQETIAFVRETRPDDVGISFSYPLPGTAFYDRVRAQLGPKRNWTDSDDLCIMFKGAYSSDFYRLVRNALHAEVDSWRDSDSSIETRNEIDGLWRSVLEAEPMSRNPEAIEFRETSTNLTSSTLISIEQLAPLARA